MSTVVRKVTLDLGCHNSRANILPQLLLERVHFFGMIRISDPRSLGSWSIRRTDKSLPRVDSPVPLMHHDLRDLESLILIQITPKKCTHKHERHQHQQQTLSSLFCVQLHWSPASTMVTRETDVTSHC